MDPTPNALLNTPQPLAQPTNPLLGATTAQPGPQAQPMAGMPPMMPPGAQMPPPQPQGPPPGLKPEQVLDAIRHNQMGGDDLSELLGKPDLDQKDVLNLIADAMNRGSLTATQAAKFAANLPTEVPQLRQLLHQQWLQNMQVGANLTQIKRQMGIPDTPAPKLGA